MTASAELPHDDAQTTEMRFDGIRAQRYTEIFLIAPDAAGSMIGGICNTIGVKDPSGAGDTTPQGLLDGLDLGALAKEYDVPAVFLNRPRSWCLDWIEVIVGAERDFNGLKARWVMWLDVPDAMVKHESFAYQPLTRPPATR